MSQASTDHHNEVPHGELLSNEDESVLEQSSEPIINHRDSFVALSYGAVAADDDNSSQALALCEKYVVKPYHGLLKVVGWRSFQNPYDRCPKIFKICNTAYPIMIFMMLIVGCIGQVATCFSRTKSTPPVEVGSGSDYHILKCSDHLLTLDVIPYVLKLAGYLIALYIFRISEPEILSTLAKKVFISFNDVTTNRSRMKPVYVLLAIVTYGVVFFLMSAGFSIVRLIGFKLYSTKTILGWFTSNITAEDQMDALRISPVAYSSLHYVLVVFAYIGFLFFDLLYIAVTINYCSQCQLLTYYIDNVRDKVRNKKYNTLSLAIKEINEVFEFLKILNDKISIIATLVMYTFLANVILAYVDLSKAGKDDLSIGIGFLNTFQWFYISIIPILLAARLTASGNELRRLGQEIAARPFYYSDTPDLELHSFLQFTESARCQANLAFIPMYPSLVYGFLFILVLLISSGIIIPQLDSVPWF